MEFESLYELLEKLDSKFEEVKKSWKEESVEYERASGYIAGFYDARSLIMDFFNEKFYGNK